MDEPELPTVAARMAMGPGLTPDREAFAMHCAGALSAWDDADDWQRRAIEAICSPLATALCGASLAVDAMLDDEAEPEQPLDVEAAHERIGWEERATMVDARTCRETITIPTHGNSHAARRGERTQAVICGRPLVNGECPVHDKLTTPTAHLGEQ